MKLNNRGWGLQVMIIFVLILMMCLVVVASLINKNFGNLTGTNKSSFDYTKLENKVEEATKKYIEQKQIELDNDDSYTVKLEKLQNEKLLNEITDNNSKCIGYSVVSKKNNKLTYKAYIKCGSNYKTKNYNDNL